jgi:3-phosphoshikimate 1-carboxyvinyltransferase
MTQLTFSPGALRGRIRVPGDKSISHRALILAALSPEPVAIEHLNPGRDVFATAQALVQMGAVVRSEHSITFAHAQTLHSPFGTLDCLNSGSTARMLMGVCAGANLAARFDGDASLRRRPMEPVAAHLRAFGARIESTDGTLPVALQGTAQPQTRRLILVSPSAQIKTALLFAALFARVPLTLLGDKGSRDHTERLLAYLGADVDFDGATVELRSGPTSFAPISIAGDFSAAAFFIVAATVSPGSSIVVTNVGVNRSRTGLLDALQQMGAAIRLQNERRICGEPVADIAIEAAPLHGISIGAELALRAIDEIPVLAAAAAFASGTTSIAGVRELRTKESDRVAAVERLLGSAGITVESLPNGLIVHGGAPRCAGTVVETQGDHRTAMAAAALAAGAGDLTIDDAASIAVSFPAFITELRRAQQA